ncbi:GTP-binding protein ypt5 [Tritrichomonas foetus]|uniref:GTP-binding protein ypt5 n=1 Tax=Tritrichomonas foetus TaxID=1144522 RepID=A0A1J4JQL3_9EUKA|nr:GTP-binding protein ypt5 [Tritrichomonas foetus]|eukprot:OHT00704.1 GTP-binding protein ypt5 [Tritrichomonas foetus]
MQDRVFPRVIFIGDSGVGKTSLISRGANDSFNDMTSPTVGAGVTPMTRTVDGKEVGFHVWDTAGQEIYRSIIPLYFKYAVCAIIVFSFEDIKSFQALDLWLEMLQTNTDHDIPVVIAGNKCDVEKKTVDISMAKKWASSKNYQLFLTSARTGEQVNNLFQFVAENYVESSEKAIALATATAQRKDGCC